MGRNDCIDVEHKKRGRPRKITDDFEAIPFIVAPEPFGSIPSAVE
jgi:hypothetical protein